MSFYFFFLTLFGDCSVTSGGGLHKAEASCVGRLSTLPGPGGSGVGGREVPTGEKWR